ncbi:uncharacterized protein LTR77_009103 [Saxophila tyrrhenica]|uniref:Uncharacterized protein n=1 Tax=Saxophila tyrrhenica TaxID=1690608 RepID=A0AAV9P2G3_9PEZI|nr:hypothetical protein LTR77_009103 [Saxophila tyrrhenica]
MENSDHHPALQRAQGFQRHCVQLTCEVQRLQDMLKAEREKNGSLSTDEQWKPDPNEGESGDLSLSEPEDEGGAWGKRGADAPQVQQSPDPPEPWCTRCHHVESTKDSHHQAVGALKLRSRLNDEAFFKTAASHVPVPFDVQDRIRKQGLGVAQKALWHHTRDHWPHIQQSRWPEGPGQISFGWTDLEESLLNSSTHPNTGQQCNGFCRLVYDRAVAVSRLRNATYHFKFQETEVLEQCLKKAQELAVSLFDETRAFQIRQLRDKLQVEAMKGHSIIDERFQAGLLGDHPPWPYHLEYLFANINFNAEGEVYYGNFSTVTKEVALAWRARTAWPGYGRFIGDRNSGYQGRRTIMSSRMMPGRPPGNPLSAPAAITAGASVTSTQTVQQPGRTPQTATGQIETNGHQRQETASSSSEPTAGITFSVAGPRSSLVETESRRHEAAVEAPISASEASLSVANVSGEAETHTHGIQTAVESSEPGSNTTPTISTGPSVEQANNQGASVESAQPAPEMTQNDFDDDTNLGGDTVPFGYL